MVDELRTQSSPVHGPQDQAPVVRGYRVSLPGSALPNKDKEELRKLFSKFIDTSKDAVELAQTFNVQFDGAIDYHITNTNYVIRRLRNDGILDPVHNGILIRAMGWLNSWYLLYLPWGRQPFHTTDLSTEVRSVALIIDHVGVIKGRLRYVIELVIALQIATDSLTEVTDTVEDRFAELRAAIKEDTVRADGGALRRIGNRSTTKNDLSAVYIRSGILKESLITREKNLKEGVELKDIVTQIAKSVEDSIKALEANLGSFRTEKGAFNKRLLKKGTDKAERDSGKVSS
ncbi:MAG: hypothetical protein Q9226_002250 [Calogaya cf. arnoldii]